MLPTTKIWVLFPKEGDCWSTICFPMIKEDLRWSFIGSLCSSTQRCSSIQKYCLYGVFVFIHTQRRCLRPLWSCSSFFGIFCCRFEQEIIPVFAPIHGESNLLLDPLGYTRVVLVSPTHIQNYTLPEVPVPAQIVLPFCQSSLPLSTHVTLNSLPFFVLSIKRYRMMQIELQKTPIRKHHQMTSPPPPMHGSASRFWDNTNRS